jgi:hypothetical protein
MYATSHLFTFGDLNFRIAFPKDHELFGKTKRPDVAVALATEEGREKLKEFDQLFVSHKKGQVFQNLREGDFWKFKVLLTLAPLFKFAYQLSAVQLQVCFRRG